jgi:hypothetical protein
MEISQSEPWDEEGSWSSVQANRKEPFSGHQREGLGQDRKRKIKNCGPFNGQKGRTKGKFCSHSTWRLSWLQMSLVLCAKVDSTECLLAGWGRDLAFKYRFV